MDLISLRKYVEENTTPGPSPILDLQKGNILEKWEDLDKEGECRRHCFQTKFDLESD